MPPPPSPSHHIPFFSTVLNDPSSSTTNTTTPSSPPPRPRPARPVPDPPPPGFTPAQRSAQARHKEWNSASGSGRASRSAESYEQSVERDRAASILESGEMLMWFAAARNESIPQTRQYYLNIVLGLGNEGRVAWREEWEIPVQERGGEAVVSPARSGKGKERERVKRRVGSAHTCL